MARKKASSINRGYLDDTDDALEDSKQRQGSGTSFNDSAAPYESSDTAKKHSACQGADEWQAAIQQNFREFETKKHEAEQERLDITMEDVIDSDDDLPSYSPSEL